MTLLEASKELLVCIPQFDMKGMSPSYPEALQDFIKAIKQAEGKEGK